MRKFLGNIVCKRVPTGHVYAKPTANREAVQLWDGCMNVPLYGSAKRDLFILAAMNKHGCISPASRNLNGDCCHCPHSCATKAASSGFRIDVPLRGTHGVILSSCCHRDSVIILLSSLRCHRSAKRDIYAKPTASREAVQLWDGYMSVLLYGSAKRDLFILAAMNKHRCISPASRNSLL